MIIEVRWFNEWWGVGGLVGGIVGSPILGPIFPIIFWIKAEFSLLYFGLLALALVGLQINRFGSDRATLSSPTAKAEMSIGLNFSIDRPPPSMSAAGISVIAVII